MIDVAARFGENLARARERADITQEVLSFRASLHRTEVVCLSAAVASPT